MYNYNLNRQPVQHINKKRELVFFATPFSYSLLTVINEYLLLNSLATASLLGKDNYPVKG
jgi:hypothetical protein